MNIKELLEVIQRRLVRKARQAEKAYIAEHTAKVTCNCINQGIQLSEKTFHCRINAMGLHEHGASQCWNQKASICPLFERKRSTEQLRRDFRKIRPNELALRWPSLGELIRFECLLLQLDEIKNEETTQTRVRLRVDDRLSSHSDEAGTGFGDGDVRRSVPSGSSDQTSSETGGINQGGKPDDRGSIPGTGNQTSMPMVAVPRSGDRKDSDRATV